MGLRGHGAIVGRVERDGRGAEATVELRHVESFEGADPLGAWRGTSFVERILDGGLTTGEALARRETPADGSFAFEGLKPGRYEVRAYAADRASARADAVIPAAGARVAP